MRGRMKHLILPALAVLLSSAVFPVQAHQFSYCDVSATPVTLSNVNLNTDDGPGKKVFENSHTINYTCHVRASGGVTFYPTLMSGSVNFQGLVQLLKDLGLSMTITIREDDTDMPEQEIPWQTIKSGRWTKRFGKIMPTNTSQGGIPEDNYYYRYDRRATITLRLFLDQIFKENNLVKTVAAQTNLLYIMADPGGTTEAGKGIDTTAFNIRVLKPGLGSIDIMPKTVHLGHFTKISDATLSRSGDFTVTARQILKPAPGQTFSLPLNISFKRGNLSFTGDRQHLALKNWGDPDDNGLQLAVRNKETRLLVTFSENQPTPDTSSPLGVLSVSGAGAQGVSNISEKYTIEVNRRSGAEVKTGEFHGSLAVEVTYN